MNETKFVEESVPLAAVVAAEIVMLVAPVIAVILVLGAMPGPTTYMPTERPVVLRARVVAPLA